MQKFCATCGSEFAAVKRPKGGAPQKHCDKACREFSAAMTTFVKYVHVVRDRATASFWREIRGNLFQVMNGRPWNLGMSGITNGCKRDARGRLVATGGKRGR